MSFRLGRVCAVVTGGAGPAQGSECRDWVARLRGGSECRVGPDSGGLGLSAMAGRVGEGMSARKMGPG